MSENKVETNSEETAAHKQVYATLDECKAVKPPSEKFKVFAVTGPDNKVRWTWGWTVAEALQNAARADGYTAGLAEPKGGGPLTVERAAAKLAGLSDEELAALGLSRKKGKK
jgi:hypothetical protein